MRPASALHSHAADDGMAICVFARDLDMQASRLNCRGILPASCWELLAIFQAPGCAQALFIGHAWKGSTGVAAETGL